MELLNKSQLAAELGRTPTYVSGMIRCGYVMKFGSKTTLKHALAWLADQSSSSCSGGFRLAQAYPALALPKSARRQGLRLVPARRRRDHQLSA